MITTVIVVAILLGALVVLARLMQLLAPLVLIALGVLFLLSPSSKAPHALGQGTAAQNFAPTARWQAWWDDVQNFVANKKIAP